MPVTEIAFARSVLAAKLAGVDLAIWMDEAIAHHLVKTKHEARMNRYEQAVRQAAEDLEPSPLAHEFGLDAEHQPFVRRPAGVERNQAGRPSSRHHQNGTAAQAVSNVRSSTGATRNP